MISCNQHHETPLMMVISGLAITVMTSLVLLSVTASLPQTYVYVRFNTSLSARLACKSTLCGKVQTYLYAGSIWLQSVLDRPK